MNSEQFQQQQKAAQQIEAGIHGIAALEVKLNRGLDLAATAAVQTVLAHSAQHLGHVTDGAGAKLHSAMREGMSAGVAAITKKIGIEAFANSPDSAFESIGAGYAEFHLSQIGHKFVDRGREVQRKLLDRERGSEVREMGVTHSDPVALQVNPNPQVIKSAHEVLADLEQRGRQYPAKKKR